MTTVNAAGRYKRWERLLDDACWKEIDDVGMFVPKGHAVLHMLAAVLLWGAVDNARLNNFEHDHIMHVKDAVLRTRGHASTMHKELEPVVDRMDAVKGMHSIEWGRGRPAESQCARLEATAWAVEYSGHCSMIGGHLRDLLWPLASCGFDPLCGCGRGAWPKHVDTRRQEKQAVYMVKLHHSREEPRSAAFPGQGGFTACEHDAGQHQPHAHSDPSAQSERRTTHRARDQPARGVLRGQCRPAGRERTGARAARLLALQRGRSGRVPNWGKN